VQHLAGDVAASALARKRIAAAISAGVPRRPIGTRAATAWRCASVKAACAPGSFCV
jgi:hypothetical protein